MFVSRPFALSLLFHYACIIILSIISGTRSHSMGKMQSFGKLQSMQLTLFFLSLRGPLCGQQMKPTLQNKYQPVYYTANTEAVGSSETLVHTHAKGHNLSICCVLSAGRFPVSEFYMPTFRNTLFHLHGRGRMKEHTAFRKRRKFRISVFNLVRTSNPNQ